MNITTKIPYLFVLVFFFFQNISTAQYKMYFGGQNVIQASGTAHRIPVSQTPGCPERAYKHIATRGPAVIPARRIAPNSFPILKSKIDDGTFDLNKLSIKFEKMEISGGLSFNRGTRTETRKYVNRNNSKYAILYNRKRVLEGTMPTITLKIKYDQNNNCLRDKISAETDWTGTRPRIARNVDRIGRNVAMHILKDIGRYGMRFIMKSIQPSRNDAGVFHIGNESYLEIHKPLVLSGRNFDIACANFKANDDSDEILISNIDNAGKLTLFTYDSNNKYLGLKRVGDTRFPNVYNAQTAVAGGDVNGDGRVEAVVGYFSRRNHAKIQIHATNNNGKVANTAMGTAGIIAKYIDVATGNFDNDAADEVLVAYIDLQGKTHVRLYDIIRNGFRVSYRQLISVPLGLRSNFVHITAGNFDNTDDKDEVYISVKMNNDQHCTLFYFDPVFKNNRWFLELKGEATQVPSRELARNPDNRRASVDVASFKVRDGEQPLFGQAKKNTPYKDRITRAVHPLPAAITPRTRTTGGYLGDHTRFTSGNILSRYIQVIYIGEIGNNKYRIDLQ